MRFTHVLGLAGFVLCSVAGGALAQQQQQGSVVYVPMTGVQGYQPNSNGAVPFYNNAAGPLPMDQLVAGKNAPSYSYRGQTRPYNLAPSNTGNDTMTQDQFLQMRSDRDKRAQQYENEYLQRLADRDAAAGGYGQQAAASAQNYYSNAQTQYNNVMNPQANQPKKKKRLVYRQDANPLNAPPRLFNPDQ